MNEVKPRTVSQFSISGLMANVALIAIFFAGFENHGNPLGAIFALFAGAFLGLKFFYWLAKGPLDHLFVAPPAETEADPISLDPLKGKAEIRTKLLVCAEEFTASHFDEVERIAREILSDYPFDINAVHVLSVALLAKGDAEEARMILLDLLESESVQSRFLPELWNNLAWACVLTGKP